MKYLSPQDLAILGCFEDGDDHSSYKIAEALDLPPWAVRSSVQALRHGGLVRRSDVLRLGCHIITEAGKRELQSRRQLRLVK
jgi:DNA-binding IclR family transcriptional regulator